MLILVYIDDVRHDVYLTLAYGTFNKGKKKTDKNVEIDMEIIDEKEQVIPVCIYVCLLD